MGLDYNPLYGCYKVAGHIFIKLVVETCCCLVWVLRRLDFSERFLGLDLSVVLRVVVMCFDFGLLGCFYVGYSIFVLSVCCFRILHVGV